MNSKSNCRKARQGAVQTTARPNRRTGNWAIAAIVFAAMALACCAATAAAAPTPPWQAADEIRSELFEAQSQLLFEERDDGAVKRAEAELGGDLRRGLAASAPAELAEIEASLGDARGAMNRLDEVGLASARGEIVAALRRGALAVAVDAAAAGDADSARSWMQIRDFRKTTRFTRPGVDGTAALEELTAGEITPHEAALQVKKDLFDTFQARLLTNLDEAQQASERGFDGRFAETAAIVGGYWQALAPEYGQQRGAAERRATDRDFARLAAAGAHSDASRLRSRTRAGRSRPRGLHRRPANPRRADQPGQPAAAVRRAGPERVRQGNQRRPGDDSL